MQVADTITEKLRERFDCQHLELLNESHMHAGPAKDSHFKLILVSDDFRDMGMVKRHQALYRLLADELAGPVHALALHLYTADEWQAAAASAPASPDCMGANKK